MTHGNSTPVGSTKRKRSAVVAPIHLKCVLRDPPRVEI
jgi:hypothetical protein